MAKKQKIEKELPEWIETNENEVAPEPLAVPSPSFTHIHVTLQGISVNGSENVNEFDVSNVKNGEIVVVTHAAFNIPYGSVEFIAQKLLENQNYNVLGIAPKTATSLNYDAATGIATYPSVSGACVAFVAGNINAVIKPNAVNTFYAFLAMHKAANKQSGYIRIQGEGWTLNNSFYPKPEAQCSTC